MKKGIRTSLSIVVLLLLLTGVFITLLSNKKAATTEIQKETTPVPFSVLATEVKEEELVNNSSFRGTIEPNALLTIYSEADGKITSTRIEKGLAVQKGQSLAVVDGTIRNATNQLNTIRLEKAEQEYELARKNKDRYQALLQANNASVVEAETAEQAFKAAQLQLQSLEQELAISRKQLQQTIIQAPANGIVIDKKVYAGDYVQPGTVLGTIADLRVVRVKIYVPETLITQLQPGDEAVVAVDVLPGHVFTGKITTMLPVANEVKAFPVEIAIRNSARIQLMAGMSASVSFTRHTGKPSLLIPRSALLIENGNQYVWVLDSTQAPQKRPITVASFHGSSVSVSSGLTAGERIITSGQNNIEPGKVLKSYSLEKEAHHP